MKQKIHQPFGLINQNQALSRELYRVWFFTNERVAGFLQSLSGRINPRKMFGVGGGGDFAFNALSVFQLDECIICDQRPLACITMDFKLAVLKAYSLSEAKTIFSDNSIANTQEIRARLQGIVSEETEKTILDQIIGERNTSLLKALKRSRLWFRWSFPQVRFGGQYLGYLETNQRLSRFQKGIDRVAIWFGNFRTVLEAQTQTQFDAIYVSNMFDHPEYVPDANAHVRLIYDKLIAGGFVFVVTQRKPSEVEREFCAKGFRLFAQEIHQWNPLLIFSEHFSYSLLVFERT